MKRSISILITLCMLISLLPMGMTVVSATNTEATPTLLFEMDLTDPSNTAGAAVAVVAATEATEANVTGDINTTVVTGATNTHKPIFNKLSNGTPYLTFAHTPVQSTTNTGTTEAPVYTPVAGSYSYSNNSARVVVPMSASIAAKDALTVETWVRNVIPTDDKGGAKKIMAFGLNKIDNTSVDKKQMAMMLQWNNSDNNGLCMYGDPATSASAGAGLKINPENINAWSHLVVTREWIKDTVDTTKGRWKTTGYYNGVLFATTYYPATSAAAIARTDLTAEACKDWSALVIGGCTYEPGQALRGDIATFKLYDGVLDSATVEEKFVEEAADFNISRTNVNKIFELEIPKEGNTRNAQVVNLKATDDTAIYVKSVVADGHTSGHKPIYRETANGTPYLTFADAAGTTLGEGENIATKHPWANASSRVGVTLIDPLNIPNENVITMATWVKADYVAEDTTRGPSNIMSIGQKGAMDGFRWRWDVSATSAGPGIRLDNDEAKSKATSTKHGKSLGRHTELDGKWSHLVVTRKWIPEIKGEGDAQTIGHWENTLYVNGEYAQTNILDDIKATERSNFVDGRNRGFLTIGGSNYEGGQSFRGDIGAFALYKTELTPKEVKTLFNESVSDFYPGKDPYKVFDLVLTPGESWNNGAGTQTDYTASSTNDTLNNAELDPTKTADDKVNPKPLLQKDAATGVNYLRFAYKDGGLLANNDAQLNIKLNDTKLVDGDAITFETWARSNYDYPGKVMFALGHAHQGWTRFGDAVRAEFNPGGTLKLYPDSGVKSPVAEHFGTEDGADSMTQDFATLANMNVYAGKWVHYVITREWTPNSASDYFGAGTWTSKLYVNGELESTETIADTNRCNRATIYNSTMTNTSADHLAIGGDTQAEYNSFEGDIASFKVYNKTFTDAEIAAKFNADVATYYPGKVYDKTKAFELTFTPDGEGSYTVGATSGEYFDPTKVDGRSGNDKPVVMTEDGVPFVRFAYKDEETGPFVNTNAALDYKLNNTALVDGDVITFEAWARSNHIGEDYTYKEGEETKYYRNKRFFALGDHPAYERKGEAVRVQLNEIQSLGVSGNFTLYPDGGDHALGAEQGKGIPLMDVSKHSGQWTHYVVTREWTPDDEKDYFGAGTWTSKLYVNGKLANTGTYKDADRVCRATDYTGNSTAYLDNDYLAIGGSLSENGTSFPGDVAKFNVYSKSFTDDEIEALYNGSVGTFYDGVAYATIKHNNGAELTVKNVASATSISIDAYIVEYAPTDAPFVMVALYDESGLVGCKKLATTLNDEANTVEVEDTYEIAPALIGKIKDVRVFILDGAETLRPLYTAPHL